MPTNPYESPRTEQSLLNELDLASPANDWLGWLTLVLFLGGLCVAVAAVASQFGW